MLIPSQLNVWIGGGVQIMTVETIGDDMVIGAGSIVPKETSLLYEYMSITEIYV